MSFPANAKCQAAVFLGPGRPLEIQSFPIPKLLSGQLLVRIELCTVCGSDVHTVLGHRAEPTPTILGHEAIGRVLQLGSRDVADYFGNPIRPGDLITWSVCAACGDCTRCRSGLPQKCIELFKYGHSLSVGEHALSGGFSEMIILQPGSTVLPIAASLPIEVICPSNCATATVAACMRQAGNLAGKRVLIFGAGMLGLNAAAFAKEQEAGQVTVIDRSQARLGVATDFGASHVYQWSADSGALREQLAERFVDSEFDVVFELSGSVDACEAALACSAIGATIVLAGAVSPSRDFPVNPEFIVRRCLTLRGVHNYAPQDLASAVAFLERNHLKYPFASLIERTFDLVQINRALAWAVDQRPVRLAIRP